MKILIAEDEEDIALVYEKVLETRLNLDHSCGSPYVELVLVYLSSP